MQLQSLKAAIQAMLAQAEQLRSPSERQTLYLHTAQVLALLLEAPGEAYPGWPQAALVLLRPVGKTGSTGPLLNRLQEQLLTVLELPDITALAALEDIRRALESAISVGAPRYNHGDIAGCARLYLATALTLVNAQVSRGFPGQARVLDTLKKELVEAQALNDVDKRAWALRRAFDRILK